MNTAEGKASAETGLTSAQAAALLAKDGMNELPSQPRRLVRRLLAKLWGPVPLMLEASAILEAILGRWSEVYIIAALLLLNGIIGFVTEERARRALELLQSNLTITARVLRDSTWQALPARQLVLGDVVRVRVGDVLAADMRILDGELLVNRAALTGESLPVSCRSQELAFAGSTIKTGEATAKVTATGVRTKFGRTAELLATTQRRSNLAKLVLRIVRALLVFDGVLVVLILGYAWHGSLPLHEAVLFAAALLIAAVPVALPATFTLAAAVGSLELTRQGIFVTHLPSIEDAAAMDVLCCDKTGTLTENRLSVGEVRVESGISQRRVLAFAATCSDVATQDPIDLAILAAVEGAPFERLAFVPFDPATKRSEATVRIGEQNVRVMKGAPSVLAAMVQQPGPWADVVQELAADGSRILAVAVEEPGPTAGPRILGYIGLRDSPRRDSRHVIEELRHLGVRLQMVTGDGVATAEAVARELGLGDKVIDASAALSLPMASYDVIAGVYPEGKHALIAELQRAGHVVGMTGDGVNDAPALRKADVGIAVANATDVAKAAAAIVLTRPGLASIALVVQTGRRIYQRMLTYTLNKLVKTLHISLFLTLGLLWLKDFVVQPRHILLLLLANDLVTMSIATDRVLPSPHPDRWDTAALLRGSLPIALFWTAVSLAIVFASRHWLHLQSPQVQTMAFLVLVATAQASVYLVRARTAQQGSWPSPLMLGGTALSVLGTAALAVTGTLTAQLPIGQVAGVFVLTALLGAAVHGARSLRQLSRS